MDNHGTLRLYQDTKRFSDVLNTLANLYFRRMLVEDVLDYSFDGGERSKPFASTVQGPNRSEYYDIV